MLDEGEPEDDTVCVAVPEEVPEEVADAVDEADALEVGVRVALAVLEPEKEPV